MNPPRTLRVPYNDFFFYNTYHQSAFVIVHQCLPITVRTESQESRNCTWCDVIPTASAHATQETVHVYCQRNGSIAVWIHFHGHILESFKASLGCCEDKMREDEEKYSAQGWQILSLSWSRGRQILAALGQVSSSPQVFKVSRPSQGISALMKHKRSARRLSSIQTPQKAQVEGKRWKKQTQW